MKRGCSYSIVKRSRYQHRLPLSKSERKVVSSIIRFSYRPHDHFTPYDALISLRRVWSSNSLGFLLQNEWNSNNYVRPIVMSVYCSWLHFTPLNIFVIIRNNDELFLSKNGTLSTSIPYCVSNIDIFKECQTITFFDRRVGYKSIAHFSKRFACKYLSNRFISVPCFSRFLNSYLNKIRILNETCFRSNSIHLIYYDIIETCVSQSNNNLHMLRLSFR